MLNAQATDAASLSLAAREWSKMEQRAAVMTNTTDSLNRILFPQRGYPSTGWRKVPLAGGAISVCGAILYQDFLLGCTSSGPQFVLLHSRERTPLSRGTCALQIVVLVLVASNCRQPVEAIWKRLLASPPYSPCHAKNTSVGTSVVKVTFFSSMFLG